MPHVEYHDLTGEKGTTAEAASGTQDPDPGRRLDVAREEDRRWRAERRALWDKRVVRFRSRLEAVSQRLIWINAGGMVVLALCAMIVPFIPSPFEHPAAFYGLLIGAAFTLLPGPLAALVDQVAVGIQRLLHALARRDEVDLSGEP